VLKKPDQLDADELRIMREHCHKGAEIIDRAKVDTPLFRMAKEIALYHHEKWDGSGYPHGLAGEAIPLSARVAAIADVFDALTSKRPYKEAWSVEKAIAYLREEAGRHFDPALVESFVSLQAEIVEMRRGLLEHGEH
jgi:putative two-component system response regulator